MEPIIKFEFKKSRSSYFSDVIKYVKMFDHFTELSENDFKLTIDKIELFEKWEYFAPLHHYITKWAGTKVWINNKLIIPYKNDTFYALQQIHYCLKGYNDSYDKTNYCSQDDEFTGWGCFRLKSIIKNITSFHWNYWYKYGKFINDNNWVIDKQKIKEILLNESRSKRVDICPCFDESKILNSIDSLPDSIDLTKDKGWQINYTTNFSGSSVVKVPIGIIHADIDEETFLSNNENINNEDLEMENLIKSKKFDNLTDEKMNRLIEYMKTHKKY